MLELLRVIGLRVEHVRSNDILGSLAHVRAFVDEAAVVATVGENKD